MGQRAVEWFAVNHLTQYKIAVSEQPLIYLFNAEIEQEW